MSTTKITASANSWGSVLVATLPRSGVLPVAIEFPGTGDVCPQPARPTSMTTSGEATFGVLTDRFVQITSGIGTGTSGRTDHTETFYRTAKHDPGTTVWRPPV